MSNATLARKSPLGPAAKVKSVLGEPCRGSRTSEPRHGGERHAHSITEETAAASIDKAAWSLSNINVAAPLQRKDVGPHSETRRRFAVPPIVQSVVRSHGQPLDGGVRALMEPRFGHDFSRVRIHTDTNAQASARAINAMAYTIGHDVVFGAGQFRPLAREGRRLLAHELTHVIQQRNAGVQTSGLSISSPHDGVEHEAEKVSGRVLQGLPIDAVSNADYKICRQVPDARGLINPFEDEEVLKAHRPPGEKQAEEFRSGTISVVRDPILEALRRNDSSTFLSRLHALEPADGRQLEKDTAFISEISKVLHGASLWNVLLILQFGQSPDYVRQFAMAVFHRNIQLVLDLLRAQRMLRNPGIVPGVREMLQWEFRDAPELPTIMQAFSEQERAANGDSRSYDEVHFEKNKTTGATELQKQTGTESIHMTLTPSELRIITSIRFVKAAPAGETYYPSNELAARWRGGIQSVWNNHFSAINDTTRVRIIFVPLFNEQGSPPDQVVTVKPGEGREDEHDWYETTSAQTAAHEFGHMIGNPDEYQLPSKISDIKPTFGLTEAEKKRSTVEGIGKKEVDPGSSGPGTTMRGIMGDGKEAQSRHIWPLLDWFNQHVKPANEAPYVLEH